jgi:hypothetical protein
MSNWNNGKIWKVVIPNYESKVPISNRRRAKYYKKTETRVDALAKKYQIGLTNGKYRWENSGFLVDDKNNRIIANPLAAGTPKFWTINGQRIYDGSLHYTARSKVARWVHEYLREYIQELPVIKVPKGCHLRVWLDMYKISDNERWDVDNQWPWMKWFLDTMVEEGKIEEDSVAVVRSSGQITYIESEERKLVFNIQII